MKTKAELLEHYAQKTPHEFIQFDGFYGEFLDDFIRPGADGLSTVFVVRTTELMSGAGGIRVLIRPGTPVSDIVRVLEKIVAWVRESPESEYQGPAIPDDPCPF